MITRYPDGLPAMPPGKNYRMEPKAAALLAEFLGSDLSRIANEVEKLIIAIGEKGQTITAKHVEETYWHQQGLQPVRASECPGKEGCA